MIKIISIKEAYNRMSICLNCEQLIPYIKMCKICKCVMPIKVRLKESECPEKKW